MPNNSVLMSNLHTDDVVGRNFTVSVDYSAAEAGEVSVTCGDSNPSPQAVTANTAGTLTFDLTHAADHTAATVTAALTATAGGAALASDAVENVSFLQIQPIQIEGPPPPPQPALAALAAFDTPAGTYRGRFSPTPGTNDVYVVVQRARGRSYRTVWIKWADFEFTPVLRWRANLPAFVPAAGERIVIRAYLTGNNNQVLGAVTYRPS